MPTLVKLTLFLTFGLTLFAADNGKPSTTIRDFAFMAGNWRSDVWGGMGEEVWTRPEGGNMIGLWRFVKDGKLVFTEHLSIEEDADNGPILRVKHFHPGMKGWEEKDDAITLKLERFVPNDAVFGSVKDGKRVTLRYRIESGVLECTLVRVQGDKRDETVFRLKRQSEL